MNQPDFRTVNRFRGVILRGTIEELFSQLVEELLDLGLVDFEQYFVDGTKMEANANKYSFVWKKSTANYEGNLQEKVRELLDEVDQEQAWEDEVYGDRDLNEIEGGKDVTSEDLPRKPGVKVVQILGGVGNPAAEAHATRLTSRMAQMVHGEAVYLPVSGILSTEAARDILMADEVTQQAVRLFDHVTTALVGIGAIEPSPLLAQSGNIFSQQELELLRKADAVGDILLRFFDRSGQLVETGLENRVISMSLDQLSKTGRAIGVAGGSRKYTAILGALRGSWINILVTDQFTAQRLLDE
jgi:hypothetical protein